MQGTVALCSSTALACASNYRSRRQVRACATTSIPPRLPSKPTELLRELASIGDDTCHRVNMVHCQLLDHLEPGRMLPVVLTLTTRCQLSSKDWQKVLIRHPATLTYAADDVEDVLDFLGHDLQLTQEQLRSVVTRFPQVFSYGVKAHLRPQLAYLQSLGVQRSELPSYVVARPLLLGEGIDTVVKFLKACGVPRKQMGAVLRSYPIDYCCRFIYKTPSPPPDSDDDRA